MTNAVVTISIGESHSQLGHLTIPLMRRYAEKIGAAFEAVTVPRLNLGRPHYEKFQLYDLLGKYDRILYLDDDIIVRPECPDVFAMVPEEKIGVFLVHAYSSYHDRSIGVIQERLGSIGWDREYFNSGVMIASCQHRDVFHLGENRALGEEFFFDQTQINFNVQKLGISIFDIGYRFNHTTAPGKPDERFDSFILHYPGKGHRPSGTKLEQIYLDMRDLGLVSDLGVLKRSVVWSKILRQRMAAFSKRTAGRQYAERALPSVT